MSLELNSTVGHYHVIRRLGEGGMGTVYLANDTRLDRKVALKTLSIPEAGFEALRAEAKILASVNHPNVLSLYDVFEHEGYYVLVTEYLPNQTLADALSSAPMALDEALDTAIALSQGIEAIHQQRIIHCDLKPSNVLLGFDRTVKIGDFGIALTGKIDENHSAQVKGTLSAISPEQLTGAPATPASDIYSLGLICYQIFTGNAPYRDCKGDDELKEAILKGKFRKPNSDLKEINQLLSEMLEISPKARINSAHEVTLRLQNIRRERTLTELTGTISVARQPRFPKWVTLSLSALISLVLLAGVNLMMSEEPPTKRLGVLVDQVVVSGLDDAAAHQLSEEYTSHIAYALTHTPGLDIYARRDPEALNNRASYWESIGVDEGLSISIVCSSSTLCELFVRLESRYGALIDSTQISVNPQRRRFMANTINQLLFDVIENYQPPEADSPLLEGDIAFQSTLRQAIESKTEVTAQDAVQAVGLFVKAPSLDTATDAISAIRRASSADAQHLWDEEYPTAAARLEPRDQLLVELGSEIILKRNDTLESKFSRLNLLEQNLIPHEFGLILRARYLWQKGQLNAAYEYLYEFQDQGYSWHIDRYLMSLALYGKNDFNAARQHLGFALDAAPENFELREIQAQLAIILGDLDSLSDVQQFLLRHSEPVAIQTFVELWLAFYQGQYEQVLQTINRTELAEFELWEQQSIMLIQADSLLLAGLTDEALTVYQALLEYTDLDVSVKAQAIWHTQSADDALIYLSGATAEALNNYERLPLHYWLYQARNDERADATRQQALDDGIGEVLLDIPWPNKEIH